MNRFQSKYIKTLKELRKESMVLLKKYSNEGDQCRAHYFKGNIVAFNDAMALFEEGIH